MGMDQNLVPLVNIKIAGKWMFIPLKMVLIGIDPYPNGHDLSCASDGLTIQSCHLFPSLNFLSSILHWRVRCTLWESTGPLLEKSRSKSMRLRPFTHVRPCPIEYNFNVHIYIYIHVYIYMYIYIYTKTRF